MSRKKLLERISDVTSKLIKEKGFISFVDVFMELGYLDKKDYEAWRMKRIPYLEKAINANLSKINFIMKTLRKDSYNGNLKASWCGYKSWGKKRKVFLRFSKSGDENIEKLYATHFVEQNKKDD